MRATVCAFALGGAAESWRCARAASMVEGVGPLWYEKGMRRARWASWDGCVVGLTRIEGERAERAGEMPR
jgi:hypothetical protein